MWTTRDGSLNGSPRKKRSLIKLKIVVFNPIPSANVMIAIDVNAGDLRSWRKANFKSFILFGAKCNDRINTRSPACRQPARDHYRDAEHYRSANTRDQIWRGHFGPLISHQVYDSVSRERSGSKP
jgi:hypothetical protein